MIFLGIDPGTLKTGLGIVNYEKGKCTYIDSMVVKAKNSDPLYKRLLKISEEITCISNKWQPDAISIENLFVNKNNRSALLLGHARGTAICAAMNYKDDGRCPDFYEFTPREIKKALVGNGAAEKDQVNMMVKVILNIKGMKIAEDASDALAAAICAAYNTNCLQKFNNLIKERGATV